MQPAIICEGFRIVTGRPNLQANFLYQINLILQIALGVLDQCSDTVVENSASEQFGCYDMASPEAIGGDYVPDGEVNVLDYGRQIRQQNLTGLGANTYMSARWGSNVEEPPP